MQGLYQAHVQPTGHCPHSSGGPKNTISKNVIAWYTGDQCNLCCKPHNAHDISDSELLCYNALELDAKVILTQLQPQQFCHLGCSLAQDMIRLGERDANVPKPAWAERPSRGYRYTRLCDQVLAVGIVVCTVRTAQRQLGPDVHACKCAPLTCEL